MPKESFDLETALEDDNVPAGLRKWAENVQGQNRKLADELAGYRTAQRKDAITGALQTLGVNAKVAVFYPSDGEPSPEAIGKWLKDNEGVFAPIVANNDGDTGAVTPEPQSDHSPVATDLVAAMRMVQDATPPAGAGTPTLLDRANEIDKLGMRSSDDRAKLDAFELELQQMARAQQQQFHGSMQR